MKYHTKKVMLISADAGRLVRFGSRFMIIDDTFGTRSEWMGKSEIARFIRTQPRTQQGSDLKIATPNRHELNDLAQSPKTTSELLRMKLKKRHTVQIPILVKTHSSGNCQISSCGFVTAQLPSFHEAECAIRDMLKTLTFDRLSAFPRVKGTA